MLPAVIPNAHARDVPVSIWTRSRQAVTKP